jgi:hypothetical protein
LFGKIGKKAKEKFAKWLALMLLAPARVEKLEEARLIRPGRNSAGQSEA